MTTWTMILNLSGALVIRLNQKHCEGPVTYVVRRRFEKLKPITTIHNKTAELFSEVYVTSVTVERTEHLKVA